MDESLRRRSVGYIQKRVIFRDKLGFYVILPIIIDLLD